MESTPEGGAIADVRRGRSHLIRIHIYSLVASTPFEDEPPPVLQGPDESVIQPPTRMLPLTAR